MAVLEAGPTGTPLQRFSILRDAELTELEVDGAGWVTPHRLKPVRPVGTVRSTLSATTLGPVTLVYARTVGAALAVDFTHQQEDYDVNLVLDGVNHISTQDHQVALSRQRAAVLSPQAVAGMHLSDGYEQLHVRFDRPALQSHLEEMIDGPVTRPLRFRVEMDLTDPALASWMRAVKGLVADLDEPSGLSSMSAAFRPWSELLMTGLLLSQPHNYSDRLAQRQTSSYRPLPLARAVELVEEDPAGDLSLTRLCTVAGVGARTLQRYFQEHVGTSPREYVQWVRLSRAHDDLRAGSDSTVTEIALRWGFTHGPRFAAAYRQRYGVLPSVTLRQGR